MKKTLFVFVFLLTSIFGLLAQITEGHITYKVDVSSNDPDMAMALSMMSDAKLDLYFNDNKTRTEMNMGSFMLTTIIIDPSSDNSIMLMDMMGMKTATPIPNDDLENKNEDSEIKVNLINESKTILGYKCNKAIVSVAEDLEFTYWYTDKLKVNPNGQNSFSKQLPGYPLEYSLFQGGLDMKFTAIKIEKSADLKLFDLTVPDGYTIQSLEDIQELGQ